MLKSYLHFDESYFNEYYLNKRWITESYILDVVNYCNFISLKNDETLFNSAHNQPEHKAEFLKYFERKCNWQKKKKYYCNIWKAMS